MLKKIISLITAIITLTVPAVGSSAFLAVSTKQTTNDSINYNFVKDKDSNKNIISHQNFKNRYQNIDGNPFITRKITPNIDVYYDSLFIFQAQNGTIYLGGSNCLWQSTDGINFTINTSFDNFSVTTLFQAHNGTIYAGGIEDGLWQSTDGVHFTKNTSIPKFNNSSVTTLFQAHNGTIYVGTKDDGLWQSTDGFHFTKNKYISYSNVLTFFQAHNGTIYVGTKDDGLYQSTDGVNFSKNTSLSSDCISEILQTQNGTIYVAAYNGCGLYQSTDGINFTRNTSFDNPSVTTLFQAHNGTIYVALDEDGLYQSTDGINFTRNTSFIDGINPNANAIFQTQNGTIYVIDGGLWQSTDGVHFTQNIKIKQWAKYFIFQNQTLAIYGKETSFFDPLNSENMLYQFDRQAKYKQNSEMVYQNNVNVIIMPQYLKPIITVDGETEAIGSGVKVLFTTGQHNIVLTLQDQYKQFANYVGGDTSTGQVVIKLWVKSSIDTSKIKWSSLDDADLYQGLISQSGNTNKYDIIQTALKAGSPVTTANLIYTNSSTMIDSSQSYYEAGTITNNNFSGSGSKVRFNNQFDVTKNGIYHFHLVDFVGNSYDAILELGKTNWKTVGRFNDNVLWNELNDLNVSVLTSDPTIKNSVTNWANGYQNWLNTQVSSLENSIVKQYGGGFDCSSLVKTFFNFTEKHKCLTKVTVINPSQLPIYTNLFKRGQFNNDFQQAVVNLKNKDITSGLSTVEAKAETLHVIVGKNVTDKASLDAYVKYVNDYGNYVTTNEAQWVKDDVNKANLGYLTDEQIKQVESDFSLATVEKNYLNTVNWNAKLSENDFSKNINSNKLADDIASDVNNISNQKSDLQTDINKAESGVNLYGNSISKILEFKHKSLPADKAEITNFDGHGTSFHNWLIQASSDYNKYLINQHDSDQSKMIWIIIGSVLGTSVVTGGIFWYIFRIRIRAFYRKRKIRNQRDLIEDDSKK